MLDYESFKKRSESKKEKFRQILGRLRKLQDNQVDKLFHEAHEKAFEKIDCLTCAFCCRYVGPRWTRQDIKRAAGALRMKEAEFESNYLRIDEDLDFVFKSMPCPFLGADKYCSIYEYRPKACREYPHTDRRKMRQIFNLTLTNSTCCPAVEKILDDIG